MGRLIGLGEASNVSDNDYILLSSPTLGERKFKAVNFSVGGSYISEYVIKEKIISNTTDTITGGTIQ